MKFEIDVEIPDGFEPTGEFRPVRPNDWFLNQYGRVAEAWGHGGYPHLILRKKPLAYEDFEKREGVSIASRRGDPPIVCGACYCNAETARAKAAALIAAADHVDRVNQQNNAA